MFGNSYSHEITLNEFRPCSVEEVNLIIDNLDANASTGIDGISTKAIKCIKTLIAQGLVNSINKCLKLGAFPDSLKFAKVSPIYKSGVKHDPSNYRPVSVLPNILIDQQYGFRPKSNTLTAVIDLITKIKLSIDNKNIALGIFIDLKKAFDTVSIRDVALNMFESYLQNRRQVVKIADFLSSPEDISCGIPQGSIIGPLLFLIYVNNISKIGLNGYLTLYADDTLKSHLEYLIEIWGSAAPTNLESLQRCQNKLIKTLYHYPFLTPTIKLYEKTEIMNLRQLYKYNTCMLIKKIITNNIKSSIELNVRVKEFFRPFFFFMRQFVSKNLIFKYSLLKNKTLSALYLKTSHAKVSSNFSYNQRTIKTLLMICHLSNSDNETCYLSSVSATSLIKPLPTLCALFLDFHLTLIFETTLPGSPHRQWKGKTTFGGTKYLKAGSYFKVDSDKGPFISR
ncbi:hypothetical protein ABMA28_000783 [Loxostege sticticalis]|uniref:Reverse transcriptase domain-containing protein n=1 Tax=Loxostege sticticalis TaxID=481309 RepID=A0ABD0T7N2_LOXSC